MNLLSPEVQLKHWDDFTNNRKSDHPVVEFFAKQRIKFISKYVPLNSIKTALDVSSGLGWSLAHLPKHISVVATDFSLNQLKHNPSHNKIISLAENLPFKDRSFPLVYEWEVLHHVMDPFTMVKEMSRLASKYLVLLEPNRQNLGHFCFGLFNKAERGILRHHKGLMYQLVKNTDFEILVCETVGWVYAGTTPVFLLPIIKKFPYKFPVLGTSNILICKRKND